MHPSMFAASRFCHNYSDDARPLQPIAGYETFPLVSLKEACRPLEKIMDKHLKTHVKIARRACAQPKDGLTVDESAALYLYTMEWGIRENSLYYVLNSTLRSAERGKLVPWYCYLKLMLTAFFKLPRSKEKILWRGVPEDLSRQFTEGTESTWWSFTSSSSTINTMATGPFVGNVQHRTLLSIESKSGRSLRNHSSFPQENEILLPPGRQMRMIGRYSPSPDLLIIQLKEIKPPYKLLIEPFPMSEEDFNPFSRRKSVESIPMSIIAERLHQKLNEKKNKTRRDERAESNFHPSQTTPLPRKFGSRSGSMTTNARSPLVPSDLSSKMNEIDEQRHASLSIQ